MRRSTMILGGIFALLLICATVFLLGGTLSASLETVTAGAGDYPNAYAAIARIVNADAAPQRFDAPLPDDPAACRLEDVTITLQNRGLFDAEWVSVSVAGAEGDIAVYSISGEGGTVPARGSNTLNLKLISAAGGAGRRTYRIQYYVYGMKRQINLMQTGEG